MSRTIKGVNISINVTPSNIKNIHDALVRASKGDYDPKAMPQALSPNQFAAPPSWLGLPLQHACTNGVFGQSIYQCVPEVVTQYLSATLNPEGEELAVCRTMLAHLLNHPNDATRGIVVSMIGLFKATGIVEQEEQWQHIASLPLYPTPKKATSAKLRTANRRGTKAFFVAELNKIPGVSVVESDGNKAELKAMLAQKTAELSKE